MKPLSRVFHPILPALAGLLVAAATSAQDVSSSPFEWIDPKGAPDELPVAKRPPAAEFPAELKTTPDIGYVVVDLLLDEKGRHLAASYHSTSAAYGRVAMLAAPGWTYAPGKRDGKPVKTAASFALLFNPAAAAANAADATPRLQQAAVVRLKEEVPDRVVYADLKIDTEGNVIEVAHAPPEFAQAISRTAKLWRFAPARRRGEPVAAEIRAPFILAGGSPFRSDGKTVPPKVVHQTPPLYPPGMKASGFRGEVLVDFTVDIEGRVRDAFVVRSLNPSFDDPALEAVRKWRFEPGYAGKIPVRVHLQVPVIFQLDGEKDGGRSGVELTKKPDLSKLPEQLRYDTPPRLTGSVRAVYPYAMLTDGREGKATIRYIVDEEGHVSTATVTSATDPAFGLALLAAVEQFTYEPALKGGRPSKAVLAFTQEFNRDERFQIVSPEDLALVRLEQKRPAAIVPLSELDEPLTPVSRRPPRFPLSRLQDGAAGQALIEFLVDEDGRARLPRIVSASEEAFGYAAMQSVASWRFNPPTRGGRAVVARAKVPVNFSLAPERRSVSP